MTETERAVHPAAAVFPRLADDDLRELAEDIKANGLIHPIVLDNEGRIVDGINRDAACDMAGVEKSYITLPAETDIVAYILSQNVRRRHLSKGQQAMAIAMMLELEDGKQTGARAKTVDSTVSEGYVSHAATIRRYAADLAPGVLANTEPFDRAYTVALARKRDQDDERERKERQAREDLIELERIRRVAPDIADLVPRTLSVAEAKATLVKRQQRELELRQATSELASTALNFLDPGRVISAEERAAAIVATLDASVVATRPDFSAARIGRCAAVLVALSALVLGKEHRNGSGVPPVG